MSLLTKSIRWRFVLWLAFLLTFVLAGFGITAFQLHRENRFAQLDEELKTRVSTLSAAVRTPPFAGGLLGERREPPDRGGPPQFRDGPAGPPPSGNFGPDSGPRGGPGGPDGPGGPGGPRDRPPEFDNEVRQSPLSDSVARLFDENSMNSFYFTVWSRNSGAVLRRSTNAPANVTQPLRPGRDTGVYLRTRGTVREAFHYTELGDCILAGRTIVTELAASSRFAGWLIAGGCAVLLLGLGGVWLLAGRALKPVEVISGAATRIAAGNLAERINVSETDDELGQLANTLNTTFARLETAFAQQKQFTADASHELRTPLAVMISEAQTTLARERTAADYRETVQACLDTAQQMRKLTESLLQLARFDAGQEKIRRDPLDLARVARDCVAQLHPLADARGVRINCELSPAETRGDADLLARVLTNLITNAIQHSRANGEIHLATRAHAGEASLTVADNGSGIAPEDLPHLFERFYRADKARARANGNSGLGLAICKAIVDAHGGSITAASRAGGGAEFAVRLSVQNIL